MPDIVTNPTSSRTGRGMHESRTTREQHRFRAELLQAVGQSLIAIDSSSRVIYWSAASEQQFGWTEAEAIGRFVGDLTMDDAARAEASTYLSRLHAGQRVTGEIRLRRKDGSTFPAIFTDTPVLDANGRLTAIIGVTTDLTEQRARDREMRMLSQLAESSHDGIIGVTTAGTVWHWNAAATLLFGIAADHALGADVVDLLTPRGHPWSADAVAMVLAGGTAPRQYSACVLPGGAEMHLASTLSPIRDERDEIVGVSIISSDITQQVQLRLSAERDRSQLEAAQRIGRIGSFEGISTTGELTCTAQMYDIYGGTPAVAPTVNDYLLFVHHDDRARVEDLLASSAATGEPLDCTHRIVRWNEEPTGAVEDDVRWVHVRAEYTHRAEGGWDVTGTTHDITDLKKAESELRRQALHDPLTGLPNRRLIDDRLAQAVRRATPAAPVTVMYMDVDRFKIVNDALGHGRGDDVLRAIADRIRGSLRPHDTLGRVGGDEFVIIAEGLPSPAAAEHVARRILSSLGTITVDDQELRPTVSIGVARGDASSSVDELLRSADTAMYRAKRKGRARVETIDSGERSEAASELQLLTALRNAIDEHEISVAFQPILDLRTGRTAGLEALARWHHPVLGHVSPATFITAAEEHGLIGELGAQLIGTALAEFADLRSSDVVSSDLWLSVNLSAAQLAQPAIVRWLRSQLTAVSVPAELVHVEITETVLMEDVEACIAVLDQLRALGVQLSIDDFGTGYSSLSYLKRLPMTAMKIDRTFVHGLGVDHHDTGIITAVIALAQSLGLLLVAEGVETADQRDRLSDLGCDLAQGFLWSPALPLAELRTWLSDRRAR